MNKDWVGNKQSAFTCNGASNHSEGEREANDFYATEPKALELLLNLETFKKEVWECACGAGHLSKVLADNGKDVLSSDLFDRGYPGTQIIDFLKIGGVLRTQGILLRTRLTSMRESLRNMRLTSPQTARRLLCS